MKAFHEPGCFPIQSCTAKRIDTVLRWKLTALDSRVRGTRCIHVTHILLVLFSAPGLHHALTSALTYTDQHLVQCEPTAYSKTGSRLPSEYQNRFHSNYRKHGKGETDHVSITGNYIVWKLAGKSCLSLATLGHDMTLQHFTATVKQQKATCERCPVCENAI